MTGRSTTKDGRPISGYLRVMDSKLFEVRTGDGECIVDITNYVTEFCRGRGDGLVSIFLPHATCGVAIIETGAGSDDDVLSALRDLLPRDDRWTHRHGSPGHGRDHVLPGIIAPSATIPVIAGSPALGTWQSIALVDTNRDNRTRKVRLSFLEG